MSRLGICGDDCDHCPRHLATVDGRPEALERVRSLWVQLGFRDASVTAESLRCRGCHPDNACPYPAQLACAMNRQLSNCGQCSDYPCALVEAAFAHSEAVARRCRAASSPDDWPALEAAFFRKRENLDRVARDSQGTDCPYGLKDSG